MKILEGGNVQETEVRSGGLDVREMLTVRVQSSERQGPKNDSMGTRAAH